MNFAAQSITKRTQEEDEQNVFIGECGNNCQWKFDFTKERLTVYGNGEMTNYELKEYTPR